MIPFQPTLFFSHLRLPGASSRSLLLLVYLNLFLLLCTALPASANDSDEKTNQEVSSDTLLVKGRIADESGNAVSAIVQVKGTKKVTVTDVGGNFTLPDIDGNAILVISGVSFAAFEINVNGRTELLISVQAGIKPAQEQTVNKGYYTELQKTKVGNTGRISSEEIEKQPVMNALLAASGHIPGLNVTQQSGIPGAGIEVRIRGTNSLRSGKAPLFVIDGMPFSEGIMPGAVGMITRNVFGSNSPYPGILNYINPGDIESIDVLKDADATSIYGSRGANGVILVTTKKAVAGKSKLSFSLTRGSGTVAHFMPLMNKEQYIQYRKMTFATSGSLPSATDYDMNGAWGDDPETDWQKILIGGKAQYFDAQASLSGGNATTQYLLTGNLHRETTVYPGQYYNLKPSVHFSLNNISKNKRLNMMVTANYSGNKGYYPYIDMVYNLWYSPNAPQIYNDDGTLNWQNKTFFNPLGAFEVRSTINSNNLMAGTELEYRVLKGLTLKARAGYNQSQLNDIQAVPTTYSYVITKGYSYHSFNNAGSWTAEPQINFEQKFGKGKLMLLAGTSLHSSRVNNNVINATGYTDNHLLESLASAGEITAGFPNNSQYRISSGYARIHYNLDDRYILNLTGRRDASSRFGPNKNVCDFGSAGIGWIFSNESFFKKKLSFISYGKLRFSYGTSGNDLVSDYRYHDLYQPTDFNVPYQGSQGMFPVNLFNPDLAPEITKKAELGLDLGLWGDRVKISVSHYRNRSSNQLLERHILPAITGFIFSPNNWPAVVQNTGWEFLLNTTTIKGRHFTWQSSFNLSVERNKLLSFPGLENSFYNQFYIIGEPTNGPKVFTCLGVDPIIGVYTFMDIHGNATFTPNLQRDKNKIVSLYPKLYGGFQNTITYKGISLDISLQFKVQNGQNPLFYSTLQPGYFNSSPGRNWMVDVLQAWQKPGDVTRIQRLSNRVGDAAYNAYQNVSTSDYNYTDASFIRLQNLMLSWQLPATSSKVKVYLQGRNLFTFTRYKGLDPENSGVSMPPLRTIVGGFQLSF